MKTYIKLTLIFITIIFCACEDVIDVDVQDVPTRLVIEASLDWEKGTTGNNQTIKLSTSTPYFDTTTNTAVTGATVKVTNTNSGTEHIFIDQNNGDYTTTMFVPVVNDTYSLEVVYNGERYTGTEKLIPVTDILEVYQSIENGFEEEDLEVNVKFIDPQEEGNYYVFKFQRQGDLFPDIETGDDEFVNGNEINWWYEKEGIEDEDDEKTSPDREFVAGDVVAIEFFGISEAYYNYLNILIEQSNSGGLFSTTPVSLKGNCINLDNEANYPQGYFRVTQVERRSYTFE